jgi:hypothetical protein
MISPPITNTAISGLPPGQVGVAGALAASARQFGTSIGVAVTGSIVASTGAGFINASHAAWVVLGGCGLAALALGVISCPADPQTPSKRGKSNAVPLRAPNRDYRVAVRQAAWREWTGPSPAPSAARP